MDGNQTKRCLFMYISHLLNCAWFLQTNFARYFSASVCVNLHVRLCVSGVAVCVCVLWSWLIKLGTVRSGFVCVINDVSPALSHGKG